MSTAPDTPPGKLKFDIRVAGAGDVHYAQAVCDLIEAAAKIRGTGIAKRDPRYIATKMENGNAIIALHGEDLAGFCYIETWEAAGYVANSGLIVNPDYRQNGLARRIKRRAFLLSRERYPNAKLFGITTSLPVMKINSDLGYRPVTFSELTKDDIFWKGCQSCPNYDVLTRTERKICLCTGMLFDPNAKPPKEEEEDD